MTDKRRVHVIACGVLSMDIEAVAERLELSITADYLPGGLHDRPNELRRRLQEAIDEAAAGQRPDLIAVGYGVCGRGTVGIRARSAPLAIPRVHDCISLFLGSDAAYQREFARCPGTYYISGGWYVGKVEPKSQQDAQSAVGRHPPRPSGDDLADKYGDENAQAIRHFLDSWKRNYSRAAFIDTGAPGRERYAAYARAMAEELGWEYAELPGDLTLLVKLLTATESTDEVVLVPPGYATVYDAMGRGLRAVPEHESGPKRGAQPRAAEPGDQGGETPRYAPVDFGLGIDAGGTYTDAVIYAFADERVVAKAKALTTKWDFTLGIDRALDALPAESLQTVAVVAVSTTLATNAIVEGHGQEVALLVMPPYGLFQPSDIPHAPTAVIPGQLEITGQQRRPVDESAVRRVAREMVAAPSASSGQAGRVGAFAVSGFASTVNPAHELRVKQILRDETGLSVTCGHELSELLNFRTRAVTAVLNARIIPRLERFLRQTQTALRRRGIDAPILVVKGDGSLMSAAAARQRPVETVLSGPAASVAAARHLTGRRDALVVDIGGTTTDTAALRGGTVRTCDDGTHVGNVKTHVRALEMRTVGLGGDSLIAWEKAALTIGPLRVAPVAWAAAEHPGTGDALDYTERHLDQFVASTRGMDLLVATAHGDAFDADPAEREVLDAVGRRPHTVAELAHRLGVGHHSLLRLRRIEEHHLVQRCGLTPTDLLHVQGRFVRWSRPAAQRLCGLFAHLAGTSPEDFAADVHEQIVRRLAVELLKKQLDGRADPSGLDDCEVCRALLDNLLGGGDGWGFRVAVAMDQPVIGIGAPAAALLPEAAQRLGAEAIIPHDADVANAIGAVTSHVVVSRTVRIRPSDAGRYAVDALPGAHDFERLPDAEQYARAELTTLLRREALAAGSAETRVHIHTNDRITAAADGTEIFLERILTGRLVGRPDVSQFPPKEHP